MNLSKGTSTSEFVLTFLTPLLPLVMNMSDLKFVGVCAVVVAYSLSRGIAKAKG